MTDSKAKNKTNKKPRLLVNWKVVYSLYKLGTLNNQHIANQYEADMVNSQTFKKTVTEAAIRQQAIKLGWKKDLAGAVAKKIKENLLRETLRKTEISNQQSDEEIVSDAADNGTRIVLKHRNQIKTLEEIEDWLLNKLSDCPQKVHISNYKGVITETVLNVGIKELTSSYKDLVGAMKDRISLDREANCIGVEGESDKDDGPKIIQVVIED